MARVGGVFYSLYRWKGKEECYCAYCKARIELRKQADGSLFPIPCKCEGAHKAREHNIAVNVEMRRRFNIF